MAHWTKFDHVTFIIAFVLAMLNLHFQRFEISIGIAIFLALAFIYDIHETKKK